MTSTIRALPVLQTDNPAIKYAEKLQLYDRFNERSMMLRGLWLYILGLASLHFDGSFLRTSMTQKAVVKNADMPNEMQQHAVEICAEAVRRYDMEKDIASYIKKDFERKYGPTWHCIVGRSYGSFVTHEPGYFIYFFLDKFAVLLFKSG
ncbi:Neuronal nitric oxide synthase protein inhibitor [Fasciola hepatica]|uniref:Dynein light chain n=1 Tax=Fasciola hepatica TaxID=6192 RepID=A0A4E0RLQ8_FASHE|nr:Neuronal nitric oxide synthase protein inhibitor [Fasciola hepatica]